MIVWLQPAQRHARDQCAAGRLLLQADQEGRHQCIGFNHPPRLWARRSGKSSLTSNVVMTVLFSFSGWPLGPVRFVASWSRSVGAPLGSWVMASICCCHCGSVHACDRPANGLHFFREIRAECLWSCTIQLRPRWAALNSMPTFLIHFIKY